MFQVKFLFQKDFSQKEGLKKDFSQREDFSHHNIGHRNIAS